MFVMQLRPSEHSLWGDSAHEPHRLRRAHVLQTKPSFEIARWSSIFGSVSVFSYQIWLTGAGNWNCVEYIM